MRDAISTALTAAQKALAKRRVSTLRLIMAAIGDRDIALRGKGKDKADDEEVLDILTKMIKQRHESSKNVSRRQSSQNWKRRNLKKSKSFKNLCQPN